MLRLRLRLSARRLRRLVSNSAFWCRFATCVGLRSTLFLNRVVEGVGELLDAPLLQDVGYVFVVEAGFSESPEEAFGLFDAFFEGRPDLGVVHDRLYGLFGHGVDGLGSYEVVDVDGVWVVGVLGRGRGPQKALGVGALLGEPAPPGAAEDFFVDLVGQFGVGYG